MAERIEASTTRPIGRGKEASDGAVAVGALWSNRALAAQAGRHSCGASSCRERITQRSVIPLTDYRPLA
jgi:hypothetical protein